MAELPQPIEPPGWHLGEQFESLCKLEYNSSLKIRGSIRRTVCRLLGYAGLLPLIVGEDELKGKLPEVSHS